jgi:hypothetical protein
LQGVSGGAVLPLPSGLRQPGTVNHQDEDNGYPGDAHNLTPSINLIIFQTRFELLQIYILFSVSPDLKEKERSIMVTD